MEPHIWKIEWNDGMSVGIPEIDDDHKRFASLINELNQSIVDRMDLSETKRRLQLVIDDAVEHFAHEERLFKQWKYPDADHHANRHAQAIAALQAIKEELGSNSFEREWIAAGLEIKDLLITHLLTEDMKYAGYYRNSRTRSSLPRHLANSPGLAG
jgi:hemerythrin